MLKKLNIYIQNKDSHYLQKLQFIKMKLKHLNYFKFILLSFFCFCFLQLMFYKHLIIFKNNKCWLPWLCLINQILEISQHF